MPATWITDGTTTLHVKAHQPVAHYATLPRRVVLVVARAGWEYAYTCGRVPKKPVAQAEHLKYTDTKPFISLTTHTIR